MLRIPDGILRFGEPPRFGAELMNAREAAAKLGIHPSTLARWRSEDTGPQYVRMGARLMYRESAIEQWITKHTVTPGEDVA